MQLNQYIQNDAEILFIDEATCHPWHVAEKKTWQSADSPIFLPLSSSRGAGVAVAASISLKYNDFVYRVDAKNNAKTFTRFLDQLELSIDRPGNTVLVMDNATYHKSKKAFNRYKNMGISVLFLPSSSSELNPIELCWAHCKRMLRDRLA